MGCHTCQFCPKNSSVGKYSNTGSQDATLVFDSGNQYTVPALIVHYVVDHGWAPPSNFVKDIMNSRLTGTKAIQWRGSEGPEKVGYLNNTFTPGAVPEGFVDKLVAIMTEAGISFEKPSGEPVYRKQ